MNKEILYVVEAVSNEKGVDREVIFAAIEAALEIATKKRAGDEMDVKVEINRKTGDYQTFRRWLVIDEAEAEELEEGDHTRLSLSQAKLRNPQAVLGEYIIEALESVEFGRIAAQKAKQVIIQKVLEAERAQIANAYRERLGQLVTGTVKRATRDFVILDLANNAEALLSRTEMIPHETMRVSDRVRAYLYDIQPEAKGPQMLVSRSRAPMLVELFKI